MVEDLAVSCVEGILSFLWGVWCGSRGPGLGRLQALTHGPPTKRKAAIQAERAFLPTVLSCSQLDPIDITPGCVFIGTILPRPCKFPTTVRDTTAVFL